MISRFGSNEFAASKRRQAASNRLASSNGGWPESSGIRSIPEILEAEGDREIMSTNGGDHSLQFVLALARHADFFALNLGGDLELAIADEAGDLFGDRRFDALLDSDDLARVAERGKFGLAAVHTLETDAAFGE